MFGFLNIGNNALNKKSSETKSNKSWLQNERTANKYNSRSLVKELTPKAFSKDGRIVDPTILGKNGILKVYAPWCPHCTPLVEPLTFLAQNLTKYGFVVVAVNSENPENADLPRLLGAEGFPSLFAIKPSGEIVPLEESSRDLTGLLGAICDKTKNTNKKLCCRHNGQSKKIEC